MLSDEELKALQIASMPTDSQIVLVRYGDAENPTEVMAAFARAVKREAIERCAKLAEQRGQTLGAIVAADIRAMLEEKE